MTGMNDQEFEELIDLHGPDQVTQLMQKVISALEQLEVFPTISSSIRKLENKTSKLNGYSEKMC